MKKPHHNPTEVALKRMLRIYKLCMERPQTNAQLRAVLDVAGRNTISRDIEFMRDRLEVPIFFARGKAQGYYCFPCESMELFAKLKRT